MSDILNTPGISLVNSNWRDGEQPNALKFRMLFGSYTKTLTTVCNLLGPLVGPIGTPVAPMSIDRVISSSSYGMMDNSERANFEADLARNILGTFNLARVIGPTGVLNPTYIPGSLHSKESQGIGYPLASGTKVQQLPFPPQREYTYTITDPDDRIWMLASDKEAVSNTAEDYSFYIDKSGTLYSSVTFSEGSTIKYDLEVPNTYSYLGAGYNCIPDLSILSLTLEERKIATGNVAPYDWGGVKVTHDASSVSNDVSRWKIELPKVISSRDQMLSTADKTVSNGGFDPVGAYDNGSKYYYLNKDVYTPNTGVSIDDNLIVLYDSSRNQVYTLNLWQYSGLTEAVDRTYYATGPKSLEAELRNDAGALLSANPDTYNSKHFFIFVLGSSLSEQLAQTSLNFSRHKHDGYDSYRVHHKDLLGAEGELQGVVGADQDGGTGGLNFRGYNRQLAYSDAKDNVHPQYLHRLGYRYGGTAGMYEAWASFGKPMDLNAMQGDLLFYPIENEVRNYFYANQTAYNAANKQESVTWDFTNNEVALFGQRRSHSVIFGFPKESNTVVASAEGAVKLYYEPNMIINDSYIDNKGIKWSLSRHGFIEGNNTGTAIYNRGLNIGWGNLFFGYREDIFDGRLSGTGDGRTEANAYWRTGEFNIVTTANNRSGQNTNSKIKQGYSYRDGFAVRALKGSNIWLSTGAESEDISQIATGKNIDGIPGTIALEASYPSSKGKVLDTTNGALSLITDDSQDIYGDTIGSGSGVFLSPGPVIDSVTNSYYAPWAYSQGNSDHFAALWNGTAIGTLVENASLDGFNNGPGALLDIFAIAPDRQKNNILTMGPIPAGTDNTLKGWVFGRPFIRGTYGINFCVNGDLNNIDLEFKTGYHQLINNEAWGPNSPVLKTGNKEYIHREFRFWGKNIDENPSTEGASLNNTQGGNINLLYNFGRNYRRWGLNKPWSSTDSLSGISAGGKAEWANSRRISLGSIEPSDYGSAIRQASFVEAFAGFRNDPLQPYTASYVLPFRVKRRLGTLAAMKASSVRIEKYLSEATFVLTHDNNVDDSLFINDTPVKYLFATPSGTTDSQLKIPRAQVFIDALIRGSEDMLIERSGQHLNPLTYKIFPASLVNFDVKLEYFIGQSAAKFNSMTTGTGSPSYTISNANPFKLNPWTSDPSLPWPMDGFDWGTIDEDPKSIYIPESGVYVGHENLFIGGDMEKYDYLVGYIAKHRKDYEDLLNEDKIMVPSYEAKIYSANIANTIPTVMKASGYTPALDPFFSVDGGQRVYQSDENFNAMVGYDAAIGLIPSTGNNTAYFGSFPWFDNFYNDKIENSMFCLMLNFGRKLDNRRNSPVPYRVFLANSQGQESTERVYSGFKLNADDGTGTNLELTVTLPINYEGPYTLSMITIDDGGSYFNPGDTVQILGSLLGGNNVPNSMSLTVGTVAAGKVTSFQAIEGTVSNVALGTGNTDVWVEIRGRLTVNTITALDTEYTAFIED